MMQDRCKIDARSMQDRLREVAGRACVTKRARPTGRQARGVRRGRPLRVRCGGAGRVRRPSASPRLPTFCSIAANSGSVPEAAIHRSFESGGDGSISTPGLSCRKAGKARRFPPARESSGNPGLISKLARRTAAKNSGANIQGGFHARFSAQCRRCRRGPRRGSVGRRGPRNRGRARADMPVPEAPATQDQLSN
jgi:hypothetical protein